MPVTWNGCPRVGPLDGAQQFSFIYTLVFVFKSPCAHAGVCLVVLPPSKAHGLAPTHRPDQRVPTEMARPFDNDYHGTATVSTPTAKLFRFTTSLYYASASSFLFFSQRARSRVTTATIRGHSGRGCGCASESGCHHNQLTTTV